MSFLSKNPCINCTPIVASLRTRLSAAEGDRDAAKLDAAEDRLREQACVDCPGQADNDLARGYCAEHGMAMRDRLDAAEAKSDRWEREAKAQYEAGQRAIAEERARADATRDGLRDELDAVGSVAKEAADWVRRLAEFAPLLHAGDRREGEAEARAWLAAWDESGPAIVSKRAGELAAVRARADAAEARAETAEHDAGQYQVDITAMSYELTHAQAEAASLRRSLEALEARVTTCADEAFGPFPVQSADESVSAIDRGIFELRQEHTVCHGLLERASAERDAARRSLEEARGLLAERNTVEHIPACADREDEPGFDAWDMCVECGGPLEDCDRDATCWGAKARAFLATPSPEGKPETKETDRG